MKTDKFETYLTKELDKANIDRKDFNKWIIEAKQMYRKL